MKTISIVIFSIMFLSFNSVFCQDSIKTDTTKVTKTYEIELFDGSVFIGTISQKDSATLIISTFSIPKIEVSAYKIKSMKELKPENFNKGSYWISNPMSTRYFFAPSAINLHKNEGYYQNTYLFLNSLNLGITDFFSIGAGIEILSTFGSITSGLGLSPLYYITPKVGFKVSNKLHLGAGVIYANVGLSSSSTNNILLGYGLATYGSLENNLTVGVGSGFVSGEYVNKPTFTFSGMTRASKRIALITENWIIPFQNKEYFYSYTPTYKSWYITSYKYDVLFSYGMRFIGNKISVDLGFVNNMDIVKSIFIGIPYVDFVVKF